ncbi:hypothetical protein [Kitasatospora sp. NPDC004531]
MLDDPRAAGLFHDLPRTVHTATGPIRFLPDQTFTEDIWTYERAPNRH